MDKVAQIDKDSTEGDFSRQVIYGLQKIGRVKWNKWTYMLKRSEDLLERSSKEG